MNEKLKKYKEDKQLLAKYNYVEFILSFDEQTDCPKKDKEYSLSIQDYFRKLSLDIITSEHYKDNIIMLYNERDLLNEIDRLNIEIEYKELQKLDRIPKDELYKHFENTDRCWLAWAKARDTLNFDDFINEEKELVEYNKKYIKWQETESIKGYDVLLNDMEEGYNTKMYDEFFNKIENELLPFTKKILKYKKKYNPILNELTFDIPTQKELTKIIANAMGYTTEVGCIRETIHPFTNWANNNDVRITTSYNEKLLLSNLYSVMHEIGHALFQLQMDPKYNDTNIFNNVTCITHESQSRFYENYLGRSRAFVSYLYPILKKLYPVQFESITENDVYYYVNDVNAQFTRTEADELTYPIHILIRYKIEKMLFSNEITVDQIGDTFADMMEEYLGIRPTNLKEGAFQDVHWSSGFGYFPTYALGSAYGAQFLKAMKKDIDVDSELSKGDFSSINSWLKEHIHQYSGTRKNLEVVRAACNEEFNADEYIKYLKEKFTKIYE